MFNQSGRAANPTFERLHPRIEENWGMAMMAVKGHGQALLRWIPHAAHG